MCDDLNSGILIYFHEALVRVRKKARVHLSSFEHFAPITVWLGGPWWDLGAPRKSARGTSYTTDSGFVSTEIAFYLLFIYLILPVL